MASMDSAHTALQVSFEVEGTTPAQKLLAVSLVAALFVALAAARHRLQFVGLSDRQSLEKSTLQGQREDQTPESVRIERGVDREAIEETVKRLFDRDRDAPGPDNTSLRDALRRIAIGWRSKKEGVPARTLVAIEEGLIIAVLGSMIFISADVWRSYFSSTPGYPSLADAVSYVAEFLGTVSGGAATFPYAGILWNFLFAYSILLITWIYHHWWLTSAILILSGVGLWLLARYVPDEAHEHQFSDSAAVDLVAIAVVLVAVWATGALVATAGRLIGEVHLVVATVNFAWIGELLGFSLAVVFLVYELKFAVARTAQLVAQTRDEYGQGVDFTSAVPAYLIVQRLTTFFIILMAPFVAIYLIVAIARGRPQIVWAAYRSGSTGAQMLIVAVGFAAVVALSLLIRDEWDNIREALSEAWARKRVRLVLFNRALPFGAMFLAFLLAWSFRMGFLVAAAAAIVVGVGARLGIVIFLRAKYRLKMWETEPIVPETVLIQSYQLSDSTGDAHYYTRVNGQDLAYDSLDGIVDYTADAVEDLFEDGQVEPSLATWHADLMFRFGVVDPDETRDNLISKVRRDTFGRLEKNGGVMPRSKLERRMDRYPDELWRDKWEEWRIYGSIDGKLEHRDGYTYLVG